MKAIAIKVAISVRGREERRKRRREAITHPGRGRCRGRPPRPRWGGRAWLASCGTSCRSGDSLTRLQGRVWWGGSGHCLHCSICVRSQSTVALSVHLFIPIFWWYYMNINQALVMQQAGVPPSALCSWWELLHLTEAGLVPGPGPAIWRVVAGGPALQPSTAATRRIWRLPASPRPQLRGTDSCSHCSSLHTARSGQQECN